MNLTHSESIKEIAAALAKAQGVIEGAIKDSANPFFKSKYADLSSVWAAVRGPLSSNGIAVIQSPHVDGARVSVDTLLLHGSGEWVAGTMTATAKDDGPQAVGSTVTYLRRYALQSFAGVAPEDDDANAGEATDKKPQSKPVAMPPRHYSDWLADLEAKADEGTEELQKAWKASDAALRDFLTSHAPEQWTAIKAKAAKVRQAVSA